MSKKRTRLKLKDNVRKTLISLLSVALLVTTIHFTNVRAEGTDEPAPTPAADVMLENAEPANNGGGEEGSNEQETEAVIPEQPAPEENIQPQVSPDTDEPKPEETFVPEEKREVVDGDPNGPNEEAEEKKEEEVTPEATEEPKPENEEENKVQEYELTFVVNADDEAVYTVYLNGSEGALVFDEEKKSVETVEEGEAEFKLAAEGYDAKVTMGEDKVEINPEENTEDTYKVDVKENTTITIELTKIEEEKEYTVEGAIELFEKWFEDQENEELYEAFVAYFENLSEEDYQTVDAYIAKRMAEAEDDDIMLLAEDYDYTVELGGLVTVKGSTTTYSNPNDKWSIEGEGGTYIEIKGNGSNADVTGLKVGTATVKHTYVYERVKVHDGIISWFDEYEEHSKDETFTIEVVEPTKADYTVTVGESIQISSTDGNSGHSWTSGDANIATVKGNKQSADVTGVKEGFVLVTHTWNNGGTKRYVVQVVPELYKAEVKADPDSGLIEGETVTYNIVLTNPGTTDVKIEVTINEPANATIKGTEDKKTEVTVPAGETVTVKVVYTITEADIKAGKDIPFKATVNGTATGVGSLTKTVTTSVSVMQDADAFDVSLALSALNTKTSDFESGETVIFDIYVRNDCSGTIKDVVVSELLAGATIVDDNSGNYVVNPDGTATITKIVSGDIVTVRAEYTLTDKDIADAKRIENTVKATYKTVSKTSNIVSILPKGLETKKVYVYMKVGDFSTEALAALGLPSGLVTNSAKYAPVGVLTVDGSFFVGKDMNGGAMLNSATDWNALQSSIISFDPNGMVDVGDLKYSKNNGSSVSAEQVMLARRDIKEKANSGKTAMFVQTSSDYMTKEYGLDSKEIHLDCVFDTVQVSFVGESGQPWKDINGKTISNVNYVSGQHVSAPGFEVEEGWVLEYYHPNGTTKWNFATDTVNGDTKIVVKKIGKVGETTVTKKIDNPKADNVPFNVGETVKFTITVQNTGNYTSKEIYVEDKLSGATITNAVGAGYTLKDGKAYIEELAPGAKVVIHAEYTVKAEDAGQNVKNVAVAKAENVPTHGEGEVEIPTEKVTITVTTTGGTFEYDGQPHGATVQVTGLPDGYSVVTATSNATATDVTTDAVAATCDTLVIKNSNGEIVDNNIFTIDKTDGSITVTPKEVKIVVNNKSKTYGDKDPQFDGSVTGLVNQNDLGTVSYDRNPEDAGKEDVGDDITLVAAYTANSNYTVQVTEGKLTINKSSSLNVTGDDYYGVYDGQAHGTAATPSVTDGTTLTYTVNGESSSTYPTITDVGSKTVTVVAVNSNYNNATDTYTLTVVPQSIDPSDPTNPDPTDPTQPVYVNISINSPSDYPYDGYEHKWAPTVTDGNGNALAEGTDYIVTYDKIDFTNVTGDITVTITGIGNYGGTVTRTYKITPKEVTIVVDNKSKTYGEDDPTFTGTVGTLVDENDLGTVTYGRKAVDANKEDAGDDITLVPTYTANSNYSVKVTNGKLTITSKSIIIPDPEDPEDPSKTTDMVANDPTNVVYNGEDQKWVPTLKDGETTLVEGTDYTVKYSSDTKNVGTVTVTITGKDNYSGTVTRTYQITPATLTVVTPTDSKVYDGTPLTKAGSVSGWIKNETAPFSTTGTQTEVGSSDNTYEIKWNDPDATAMESNYTISATVGKLTVTEFADEIVVTTTGGTFDYTGTAHGATVSVSDLPDGYTLETATSSASVTDVTTTPVTATCDTLVIKNAQGVDVTSKMNIRKVDGSITVNPATLTVVTNSASKTYDGTPLTAGGSISGFVNGEDATFAVTGTITAAGETDNTYTITWDKTAKESNYRISATVGKLNIDQQSINPNHDNYDGVEVSQPADTTYTGTEQKQPVTVTDKNGTPLTEGTDYTISYTAAVDAGTVTVTITGNGNYEGQVTRTYKINPATLTVVTPDANKTYDGTALTAAGSISGFVNDEKAPFNTTGTQTIVGSSDNTYEINWNDPTATAKATNYTVDDTVGTLRVDAKSIEDPNDPYKPNTKAGIDVDSPVDFKYDGQAHKYVPVVKDGDKTLVEGTDYTVTYKNWDDSAETTEFTHKSGTIRVYITGIGNYSGTVRRLYCINPRLVKGFSDDATREYNGEPLENHTVQIYGDGFVEGEGATYKDWASITDVGSTRNTFMREYNENTIWTDYTWEYGYGLLKVTPAKITVYKEEYQTYTGDEIVMNITEADVTSGTLYARDNIKISAKVKGTTVGDYEEVVDKTITGTTKNYDITVIGKLHITAAKTLDFTATGCDVPYDGDPHTGTASSTVSGTTFQYSTDGGETWVDTFPSITDAGQLNVKVKASNPNYEDATKDVVLKISKKAVTAHRELTQEYTGSNITMNITAADITGLVDGDDVTLSAAITGKEANVYQTLDDDAVIGGADANNYSITVTGKLTITAKNIDIPDDPTKTMVSNDPTDVEYNGQDQKWVPELKDGGTTLVEGTDYTVTYSADTKNVGTVTVTIEGKGNYTGTVTKTYQIYAKAVTANKIESHLYSGSDITMTITQADITGIIGSDDVTLSASITGKDIGDYTTLNADPRIGGAAAKNYSITVTGTLTITAQSITPGTDPENPDPAYDGVTVTDPADTTYNGTEQKMPVVVADKNGTPLTEGTDYTIDYTDATDAGTVTVTITGINNFTGTVTKTYTINQAPLTIKTDSATKVYDGTALIADGELKGLQNSETVEFTVTGTQTIVGSSVNTYNIDWTKSTANQANYTISSETKGTLKVTPQSINPDDPKTPDPENPDNPVYTGVEINDPQPVKYDGTEHKWEPTVTDGTTELEKGKDYTVTYNTENFTDATGTGTIAVTIKGEGNYGGEVTKEYKITPRVVSLTSGTDEKNYDGDPLKVDTVTEGEDKFVAGEGADYSNFASITEFGSIDNTFDYALKANTKATNYSITQHYGTLTIKKAGSMTVTGKDYYGVYDGSAHGEAADPSVKAGTTLTYSVDGAAAVSAYPTITEVGSKSVLVTAKNSNYDDATDTYTLTVVPQSINPEDPKDPDPTDPTQPVYSGITVNDPGNYEYDNSRHIWEPTVTAADGQPALVKGTDYTVRYEDKDGNVLDTNDINSRDFKDVKEITVIITGTGNYGGEVRKTYEITRKTVTVKATIQRKYYGEADKPYQVSVIGLALFDDSSLINYDVTRTSGEDVIPEPYYPIIVTGDAIQGNYNVVYVNAYLEIMEKHIEGMVANKPEDVPYNGKPQEWEPIMKDGDKVLVKDNDYTVYYSEDTTNVGEVEVTITGIGNYGGKQWPKYNITPAQLTVTTESATKVYDGTALIAPGRVDGLQNKETVAFTVTGTQTEVGNSVNTYTLAWTGTAKETNYTIVTPENLGTLTVTKQSITPGTDPDNPDPSYEGVKVGQPEDTTYTGTEQKMPVDVTDKDGNPLTPGDDYTITYTSTTDAGDVTVTITGINNYTGTVEKTYKINPAPLTVTTPSDAKVYDGAPLTKAGNIEGFVNSETATFTTTGTQTAVGKSTNDYSLVFDRTAKRNNYSITEDLGTLTVCKQSIDPNDPTDPNPDDPYDPIYAGIQIQDPTDVTYNGQNQKWTPTVTTKDGTDLREGIDYEVQYDTNDFTNINTAITVTIIGKGSYGGEVHKVYAIAPAKVTVTAEDKSKTYGEADPALTATVSGLVNNEPESLITYTLSRAPGEEVNGSPYPIAPQGSETQGNYTVEYRIGNLTINPKKIDSNDINVDDPGKYTYNGKEQKYVPEVVDNTTQETLTQTDGDYTVTYVDKDGNPVTDFTNVNGDITVIITGNGNYTGTVEKTYHIDPKTVKVTTENGTKVFDNDYLEGTGTIEGIVDGETVTFEVTGKIKDVQLDPAGNVVGVDNTYEITWDGTAKSTNYVIDPTLGQLTVTPRPIDDPNYNFDVENLFDRYYNGMEQKETPVVIDVDSKPDYEDEEYEDYEDYEDEEYEDYEDEEYVDEKDLEPEEENKTGGIDHVVVQPKIAALSTGITAGRAVTTGRTLRYGIDYTVVFDPSNNYVNVTGQPIKVQIIGMGNYKGVINRTYYILARTLQITTPSASKVYDGTPLKATTFSVSGLVNGETVTVSVTGSQTAVGSSQNTYTINWGTAKAFNYVLDNKLGTLTVTAPAVGPTPPVVPPTEPDTPTPVTPVVPVQPVVVADDETPGAPTELLLERLDEELVERGEFGLRGGYCILHIFIFLLAAVVEAFLLAKVKKDNKELEDSLEELDELGIKA